MSRTEPYSVRREITTAFIDLMKEKSYMDITVTDIITKAEVARASFYRNYNSISDVIDEITDKLTESFIENIYPALESADNRKMREFLFNYFYHISGSKNHITSINPQNMSVIISRIDTRMKAAELARTEETVRDKYVFFAKLGLINSVAKWWLNGGMKETPEEIIDYIMSCISLF